MIRQKIFLVAGVPLCIVIALCWYQIHTQNQKIDQLQNTKLVLALDDTISALMHAIQQEGGTSVGFVLSQGKHFAPSLARQRAQTNIRLQTLQTYVRVLVNPTFQHLAKPFREALRSLSKLPSVRTQIDLNVLNTTAPLSFYAQQNTFLLNLLQQSVNTEGTSDIAVKRTGHVTLLRTNELASLEGASLSEAVNQGYFEPGQRIQYQTLIAQQEYNQNIIRTLLPEQDYAYLTARMQHPKVLAMQRMREVAAIDVQNIDPLQWHHTITNYINFVNAVQAHLSSQLSASLKQKISAAKSRLRLYIGGVLFTILFVSGLLFVVSRDVSQSFNLVLVLRNRAEQTRTSLQRNVDTLNFERQQQDGVRQLNDKMAGEQSIAELTCTCIRFLCHYVRAQIGVFYVVQGSTIKATGSSAVDTGDALNQAFEVGEGLVGQVAATQQMTTVSDIPDDYLTISTGTGQSKPKNITIVPLIWNQQVIALLEFGSLQPLPAHHIHFIALVSTRIAIAIETALSRDEHQVLLTQTQAQAQELQDKARDLKASHDMVASNNHALEQAQVALDLERQRLNDIIQGTNVGTWEWQVQTGEATFNERWAEMIGYTLAALSPTNIKTKTDFAHKEDVPKSNELLEKHFNGELDYYSFESRIRHRNGEWVWILDRGTVVEWTQDGKPLRMSGTQQDITERKKAEAQLEVYTSDLEFQAWALEEAKDKAEQAAKGKSQFLATMSHEIRTPMNGVLGMAELLNTTTLNKVQQDYVRTILNSGHLLLTIINDILDYSKLEADKVALEQVPFNLQTMTHDVLDMLGRSLDKPVELLLDYPPNATQMFLGDPARLRQILFNLLGNAIKFTKDGHVSLCVSMPTEQTESFYTNVRLEVKDTGLGMTQAQQTQLFQSFSQADSSTTRIYGGTGLGLAISQRLVKLMGSEISVASEYGQGSTFHFQLTLAGVDPSTPGEIPALKASVLQGIRILLVEGYAANAALLQRRLQFFAATSTVVTSTEAVLSTLQNARAANTPYDLLILDDNVLAVDDFSLAQQIRADATLQALSLVLLTASNTVVHAKTLETAGFSAYLTKPVRNDILQDVLIAALEHTESAPTSPMVTKHSVQKTEDKRPTDRKFQGHILLVEDVVVNQKVAMVMLTNLGVQVDLAEDGVQALECWRQGSYDLIFMDCRMPNMDGYEATQCIRAEEQNTHIPIIALTANATHEDTQQCRDVGMDSVVTKPFHPSDLERALDQWLVAPSNEKAEAEAPVSVDTKTPSAPLEVVPGSIDIGILENMKTAVGEVFPEIVQSFYEGADRTLGQLGAWQPSEGDIKTLRRLPHSLKSSSANVGAMELSRLSAECEACIREQNVDEALAKVAGLQQEYQNVIASLRVLGYEKR